MKHSKLEKYFNQKAEVRIVDDKGKIICSGHFPNHDRPFEIDMSGNRYYKCAKEKDDNND